MNVDLGSILLPETPIAEIVVRGVLTYLAIFVLLRIMLKRQSGTVGVSDLLVVVLIADAASNAMADDYRTVADGLLLVATILVTSYAVDWLGFHVKPLQRLVHPGPLPLIEDGRMLIPNMRSELITREELMAQLRLQGVEDPAEVRRAFLEGNGELSVVKMEESSGAGKRTPPDAR